MADLVEWLGEQLRSDERVANAALEAAAAHDYPEPVEGASVLINADSYVLRTIAAHRAILAEHRPVPDDVGDLGNGPVPLCPRCQDPAFEVTRVPAPCWTLLLIAAIYQDRPGFDPSWTVEDR